MRVAIVGEFPVSREEFRGGVEAITYRLAEGLARIPDVSVEVVTCTEEDRVGLEDWGGYPVHRLAGSPRFGNINFALPERGRIARELLGLAPDVVHAHSLGRFAMAAFESGFPAAISIHGVIEEEIALLGSLSQRLRYIPRLHVVKRSLALGEDFVIVSPYVARAYAGPLAAKRTYFLETSVSPRFFVTEPREEGLIVLQSGPVIPRKGAIDLVRAAPAVLARHPAARFHLAGGTTDAAYKRALDAAIRELGLEASVAFLGRLSPEALAREIARSACVVLPSLQETAPIAIQEAMAGARPVVASDAGGNADLVAEGETGFVVRAGDAAALGARLVDLLGDAPRREAMGRRARALARQRFDMDAVARGSVAIYEKVIEARRREVAAKTRA